MGLSPRASWAVPASLLSLCIIPVGVGIYGLLTGTIGTDLGETTPPWETLPTVLFIHIIGMIVYLVLGALQFAPRLRKYAWHKRAGRIGIAFGLVGAIAGIGTAASVTSDSGPILFWGRVIAGIAMSLFMMLGITSILKRAIPAHRAWMIRSYALSINAGTLPFIYLPILFLVGQPELWVDEIIQVGGWVINLLVAEWIIRRGNKRPIQGLPETGLPA